MNRTLIASTRLDHTVVRLLKTETGYLVVSRQRPQKLETAAPVPFLTPFSGEWRCYTEPLAKAAFDVVVVMERITGLLLKGRLDALSASQKLWAELEAKESVAKLLMEQTGDLIEAGRKVAQLRGRGYEGHN